MLCHLTTPANTVLILYNVFQKKQAYCRMKKAWQKFFLNDRFSGDLHIISVCAVIILIIALEGDFDVADFDFAVEAPDVAKKEKKPKA